MAVSRADFGEPGAGGGRFVEGAAGSALTGGEPKWAGMADGEEGVRRVWPTEFFESFYIGDDL